MSAPQQLYALIMAGGQGTRFWPLSTAERPKQFLKLVGEESLLTQTLKRLDNLVEKDHRWIVSVAEQSDLIAEHGKNYSHKTVFEPSGRNTMPCIFLSLIDLLASGVDEAAVLMILSSDHVIQNVKGFQTTLKKAADEALKEDCLVTIGIPPTSAHTGYGYIEKGEGTAVAAFKEKPDLKTAQSYVKSGNFFWNAGIFVGKISTYMRELEAHCPQAFAQKDKIKAALYDKDQLSGAYGSLPAISIDYAIMEKAKKMHVVPAEFDWNDLGSWTALEDVVKPVDQNIFVNNEAHKLIEANGNIIHAPGKKVCLLGVEDLVIVETDDVLMVLPKSRAQEVKKFNS